MHYTDDVASATEQMVCHMVAAAAGASFRCQGLIDVKACVLRCIMPLVKENSYNILLALLQPCPMYLLECVGMLVVASECCW